MPAPSEQARNLAAIADVRHGFFGRSGGASTGEFAGLNVSTTVGDDLRRVAENRAQVAAEFDLPVDALTMVRQTHSSIVHVLDTAPKEDERPEGDAMVTATRGLLLGVLTADCTPVLLSDPAAGVVGAFHAGWKGAVGGIAVQTVVAMRELGADPARIVAAIGPTISQANYEVGPDFAADVLAQHPGASGHFTVPTGGREHFDLPGFVADQLHAAGVGLVEDLDRCTYADPHAYFSHRYATHKGTRTGRQIAVIGLA